MRVSSANTFSNINKNVFVLVYHMGRNQITAIMAKLWKREVFRTARNIVALRRPRRKLRKNFLIVSISLNTHIIEIAFHRNNFIILNSNFIIYFL